MKTLTLVSIFLAFQTLNSFAQIQLESVNRDSIIPIPESKDKLWVPSTGQLMIVKIDSAEYELDSLSLSYIDKSWIQSVKVIKDDPAKHKYGVKGEHGVVIISLFPKNIDDFRESKKTADPIKIIQR